LTTARLPAEVSRYLAEKMGLEARNTQYQSWSYSEWAFTDSGVLTLLSWAKEQEWWGTFKHSVYIKDMPYLRDEVDELVESLLAGIASGEFVMKVYNFLKGREG
jgi:hypothetical protein